MVRKDRRALTGLIGATVLIGSIIALPYITTRLDERRSGNNSSDIVCELRCEYTGTIGKRVVTSSQVDCAYVSYKLPQNCHVAKGLREEPIRYSNFRGESKEFGSGFMGW